jgi:hypothetical protein
MARRDYDFSKAKKDQIKAWYGFTCAACGADRNLSADHWIAADVNDQGVCLCNVCNGVKASINIPEIFRLAPKARLNIVTHAEYNMQIDANQEAFAKWVSQFRGFVKGRQYNLKNLKNYDAPY